MPFLLPIPTKPFLRKYIQFTIGAEFLSSSGKHPIEVFLSSLLDRKFYDKTEQLEQRYTDKISRIINGKTKNGYSISQEHVIYFNNYVQLLFAKDLSQYCVDFVKYYRFGGQILDQVFREYDFAITERERRKFLQVATMEDAREEFANKMGIEIEVDITAEYLKKIEYRYRLQQGKNIFSEPVPLFSGRQLRISFDN